jgi:putative salt-induced outer membrane protein YdiY
MERLPPIVNQDALLPPPPIDGEQAADLAVVSAAAEGATAYTWYQPAYYLDPEIWDGSIELGVNGSSGNTETFNISAGYDLRRETDHHVLSSDLKYFNASTASVQTQNNALFNAASEWKWAESPWTWFVRTQLQFDEFQPFEVRFAVNSGLGFRWVDTDTSKVKLRFGAGASRDLRGPDTNWTPEALFGMDAELKLNSRQKLASKLDYYPAWDDFSEYRMISDVSWQIVLDEATNLSLKLGAVAQINNTADGSLQPTALNYVALLLWKL